MTLPAGQRLLGFKLLLAGTVVAAVVFLDFPQIDIYFSRLFFEPSHGFVWRENSLVLFSYYANRYVTIATLVGLLSLLTVTASKSRKIFAWDRKAYAYLLLVLVLGPGLLVNAVLKDHWGRARPHDIRAFGGTREFTPALVISNQCTRNCSFVSGHSSVLFYFASFGLLLRGRRKWIVIGSATALGALVGLGRIVQGDHFLSDVVFSGLFVALVARLLYWLFYECPQLQRSSKPPV
jgi:lipid A 4'-phosphatase